MPSIEYLLLGSALLLLVSILASKASRMLGIPALLLFLVIGMLAGSDGIGGIYFDDPYLAQALGVVALVLILFSGGMDTDWQVVRPVVGQAVSLATLGVLITALLVGWFATAALGLGWIEGLLLGAIVSSTDAAAVFAAKARGLGLGGRLESLLELESGSNDPMAVFLTAGLIQLLTISSATALDLIPLLVLQVSIGTLLGLGVGKLMAWLINHLYLEYEGLYPVLSLACVLLLYGLTAVLGGSGFLAVYLAGIVLGNSDFAHKRSLMRFHDGLAWLMQIVMFLVLGLLVFPSRLIGVAGAGLLLAVFMIFIARPVSVFVALSPFKMSLGEKKMVAWAGLRGAVPIVLATFPLLARLPHADLLFNLVFFIVLVSILVQGTGLGWVARRLGVATPTAAPYHYPLEYVPVLGTDSRLIEVTVPPTSPAAGRTIVDLHLPRGALVVTVGRDGDRFVPNGATVIHAGDRVQLLVDPEALPLVHAKLEQLRS